MNQFRNTRVYHARTDPPTTIHPLVTHYERLDPMNQDDINRQLTEATAEPDFDLSAPLLPNPDQYQIDAARTESPADAEINRKTFRLLHAGMGFCTEAGEFQDALKRNLFYGKPLSDEVETNLVEELGDLLWYIALACNALEVRMSDVMAGNIAKLKARYPEKFTSQDALNRDTAAELEAIRKHQES